MSAPNPECSKIQESLSAFIDGESFDCPNLESHLKDCAHCQEVVKGLNDVKGALKTLAPSVPTKDFTSDLENRLNKKVLYPSFSSKAVAAALIGLAGLSALWIFSSQKAQVESPVVQVAVKPDIEPDKIVKAPVVVIAEQPKKDVEIKTIVKTDIEKKETEIKEKPVAIALNTDLSGEDGLFDELGFSSNEDGLYAIKL